MKATENEEKLKTSLLKYKNQIKKLRKNNNILIKRFRYSKNKNNHSNNRSKVYPDEKEHSENINSIRNQQLQNQYMEYMKQFENIKRR
jgi:hypothetical protein